MLTPCYLLFGGLVQGKITSLDAREILELPDDIDSCSR